jgi:uncharacterized protein YecT (DUF1311 family)
MRVIAPLIALIMASISGTAAAQECLFIRGIADRLRCANPAVRAANAAMNQAYAAFAARAPAARTRLAAAQRRWRALRDVACDVRHDWEDEAKARCLIAMTDRRRAALAADRTEGELIAGEAGAEPLAVDTLIYSAPRSRCTVVIRMPRLGRFGYTRFEAAMGRAAMPPSAEPARTCAARNRAFTYHDYDLDFRVTWHSARVVAVTFDEYIDTGNAHPIVSLTAVTYDFPTGRVLTLADVVDGARGRDAIIDICRAMVATEIGNDAAIDGARFAAIAGDLAAWTVEPTQATISFNPGTIVAGPAPGFACTLPLATLRPFLRAGNPLW